MKRTYLIYLITNLVNGKLYVGRTIKTLKKRWQEHITASRNPKYAINFAIAKYGPENFKIEVIEQGLDFHQMIEKEGFYIKYYNSIVDNGYNLVINDTNGGYEFISESTQKKLTIAAHNCERKNSSSDGAGIKYKSQNKKSPWLAYLCIKDKFYSKYFQTKEEAVEWRDLLCCYFYREQANIHNIDKKDWYLSQNLEKFFNEVLIGMKKSKNNYFGVIIVTRNGLTKIRASIKINQKNISLGTFSNEKDAAIAYDKVKWFLTKNCECLNFPELISEYEKLDLEANYNRLLNSRLKKKYSGAYLKSATGIWFSSFTFNKEKYSSKFDSEILAAENFDKMQLYFYKDKAKLNFPEKRDLYQQELDSQIFKPESQRLSKRRTNNTFMGVSKEGKHLWYFGVRLNGKTKITRGFTSESHAAFYRDISILDNCLSLKRSARLNFPIASLFHSVIKNPNLEVKNVAA